MPDSEALQALMIESTRGPDDEPVCVITWCGQSWAAPVADVRGTALDLTSCAAYAEMTMQLVTKLGLPAGAAAAFVTDLLEGRGGRPFGRPTTVRLLPAGSTKTGQALVLIRRGGERGVVDAAEARRMALRWLEVAEGTESDQLVSEAMRAAKISDDQQERVFGYLRQLRR